MTPFVAAAVQEAAKTLGPLFSQEALLISVFLGAQRSWKLFWSVVLVRVFIRQFKEAGHAGPGNRT